MENCSICHDSINASTGHCTLSCSHSYHIQCLTKWSSTNPSCPLCRHSLSETEKPEQRTLYYDDGVERIRNFLLWDRPLRHWSRSEIEEDVPSLRNFLLLDSNRPLRHWSRPEIEEDTPSLPPPREGEVFIQPGTNISVYEGDVKIVMEQTQATRSEAVRALIRHPEDIVNAILMISDYRSRQTHRPRVVSPPPPPRDPLVDPSFDQTMTTALQRMFDEDYSEYKWNSYYETFWRGQNFTASAKTYVHENFQRLSSVGEEKLEEGYWSA